MTNAGAALPPEHIARLRRALPQVRLYSMYGLTECTRVTYLPPEQLAMRPASVGKGMPNEELYVLDPEGRRCAPGEIGELVVRGSHLMQGYWGMPDATARALRCGPLPGQRVLYSGDLFRTDEEGYLYFVARQDDIIKTRGEKVSPREVEDVLYELPGVSQAAVVGVPDPLLGAAIKAVLVLAAGFELTRQAVLRHCAARLEDFMVPRIVEFREELPQTASGKIARALLAQQPEEVV
jgi:long-chain acyl-CoA synthetase